MDMRTLGILAACLALPASAINRGRAPRWAPARETGRAELVEKSATGVSPVPTSRPELAAVDLFRRADDYSLPDDYCGWYNDFKCELTRVLHHFPRVAEVVGGEC